MAPGLLSRIFVVDDEPVIAATLATILRMNGFSARYFTSPIAALESARLDMPDLLISDIAMAELSGVDLAISMSTPFPQMKILLFSGQASTLDLLEAARNLGYQFHIIAKPVHPTVLISKIQALAPGEMQDGLRNTG